MLFKRLILGSLVLLLFAALAPISTSALTMDQIIFAKFTNNTSSQPMVLGDTTYPAITLTRSSFKLLVLTLQPISYDGSSWNYQICWSGSKKTASSMYVSETLNSANKISSLDTIAPSGCSNVVTKPSTSYHIQIYNSPNAQKGLLIGKYFTALNAILPNPANNTSCQTDADCSTGNTCAVVGSTNSIPPALIRACVPSLPLKSKTGSFCPMLAYPFCPYGYNSSTNADGCTIVSCKTNDPVLQPVAPTITSISPTNGPAGSQVTVTGTGFSATGNYLSFNGTMIQNLNAVNNTIKFVVPQITTGTYPVFVALPTGQSQTVNFTVTALANTTILGDVNGDSKVDCSDYTALQNLILNNSFASKADLNSDGKVDVVDLQALINILLKNGITYCASGPAPTITSLSPNSGAVGSVVTVNGTGITTNGNTVTFYGGTPGLTWTSPITSSANGANLNFAIPTQGTLMCPAQQGCPLATVTPGIYYINITNANGTTNQSATFTVTNNGAPVGPSIVTSTLSNGIVGATYSQNLVPANFYNSTPYWTIASGNLPNGLSLNSGTGLISGTPTTAGTFNFTVNASQGNASINKALSIIIVSSSTTQSPPTINSLSPVSGAIGAQITITGTGFSSSGNKIKFGSGSSINNLSSTDGNTLTFVVPTQNNTPCGDSAICNVAATSIIPGAYNITVSNSNGLSNGIAFTVTASLAGDVNKDGKVDCSDIAYEQYQFLSGKATLADLGAEVNLVKATGITCSNSTPGDLNFDGKVDCNDVAYIQNEYLQGRATLAQVGAEINLTKTNGLTCSNTIIGDLNGDGNVNCDDVITLQNLILSNNYSAKGDINGDGKVNVADLQALINIVTANGITSCSGLGGLLGDLNSDGKVDCTDYTALQNIILAKGYSAKADMNGDGSVNIADLQAMSNILLANGIKACTSTTAAPTLSSLTPASGPSGTQVTVNGSGFSSYNNTLNFCSNSITGLTSSSGSAISFTTPVTTGVTSCGVTVTNSNGTSNSLNFGISIVPPPTSSCHYSSQCAPGLLCFGVSSTNYYGICQ